MQFSKKQGWCGTTTTIFSQLTLQRGQILEKNFDKINSSVNKPQDSKNLQYPLNMKKNLLRTSLLALLTISSLAVVGQYHYVGTYNWDGKPDNLVNPSDVVSASFRADITATLPEYRSVPVYNPRLISNGRPETISLSASSDVWVSFVDEGAMYQNSLGYYTYPTNAPLGTKPAESDIKIIFANASKAGAGGSLEAGFKVFLGNFPANTSIGFVLIANGWDYSGNKVGAGNWKIFSDSRFNPEPTAELRKHCVTLFDTVASRFVIGMEDIRRDGYGSDEDFNDLLFYVKVSPVEHVEHRDSIPCLTKDGSVSFSGNSGGLESKSLGDAVSRRVFNKAINSTQGPIDYNKFSKVNATIRNGAMGVGGNTALTLADIMPSKILDSGYTAYVSTATDITSITNAVEVRSVDFTINNECRAVAFATKTLNQMYDHTKPICDRLKGAELLGMENFSLNGLNFVRYTLLQPTGNIEYSISFSVGKKAGRNSFSFQSNWLNKDYVAEDTLYNYQVWAATPYYSIDMTLDIINKLKAIMPVQALNQGTALPKTYIVSGKREGTNLKFNINNTTAAASGYFQIEERQSEKSTTTTTRNVPVTVAANAKSTATIPVSDAYEATISLFLNNKLQDVVFLADGSWNIDYNKSTTVIKSYNITNDTSINSVPAGDLPVFRNVAVEATTSDFVTVYKLLKGGGAEQDLTDYKTLKFTANATGANMRITLVKAGVTNWADQYSYYVPVTSTSKEYSINLSDFKSDNNKNPFVANDITTIIFALETGKNVSTAINASISKTSFSKSITTVSNTIETKDVQLYPNPSKGRFVASFKADNASNVTLKVTDANSGRLMFSKSVSTVKGDNNVPVELTQSINTNIYILSIEAEGAKYIPKKLIIQQ